MRPDLHTRRGYTDPRFQLALRTRAEVAQIMGLGKERVRQIEREALRKLRRRLERLGITPWG